MSAQVSHAFLRPRRAGIPRGGDRALLKQRRHLLLAATAVFALGCASDLPVAQFTLLTTAAGAVAPRTLETDVVGRSCFTRNAIQTLLTPPWMARRANHALAVEQALASVPDANVLTQVTLLVNVQQYLLFQRVCAIATGDAGRIE